MLVIGASGYIGRNLALAKSPASVLGSSSTEDEFVSDVESADVVVHLAARQRGHDAAISANLDLTRRVVDLMESSPGPPKRLVFASSIHAGSNSVFGKTKLSEEEYIRSHLSRCSYAIIRIPHTYGPFAKPHYNSVFATFATAVWHNTELRIAQPRSEVSFLGVHAVVDAILTACGREGNGLETLIANETIGLIDLCRDMKRVADGLLAEQMSAAMTSAFLSYR